MNSKGIQPKVGMVYALLGPYSRRLHDIRVITGITSCEIHGDAGIDCDIGRNMTSVSAFLSGRVGDREYEIIWSEEIRDEWLNAADELRNQRHPFSEAARFAYGMPDSLVGDHIHFLEALEPTAQSCESLAYDGMAVYE